MKSIFSLALLGLALCAAPALAQTKPATKKAARPASTSKTGDTYLPKGSHNTISGYAAPGEPINVRDNGKNTPPYDGPAAGHGSTDKGMTMPRKQ